MNIEREPRPLMVIARLPAYVLYGILSALLYIAGVIFELGALFGADDAADHSPAWKQMDNARRSLRAWLLPPPQ